jgi:PKD repeat protein
MPNRRPRPRSAAARLLAIAAVLLVALLLPAAASADGWLRGPALTFADDPGIGQLGTFSKIGTDAAGVASLAWLSVDRAAAGEASARLTRIAPDGTTGPAQDLGRTVDPPALAVAPSGATAVAWPDDEQALRLTTIAPSGAQQPTRIVAPGPASNVDVGVSDGGDAVVIWTGDDGALHIVRVGPDGQLGPHESIAGAGGEDTRVAVARNGGAWVVWLDGGDPWAARLTAGGAIDGAPVQLSDSGAGFADVVAGAEGAVAIWTAAGGTDEKALISRLAAGGDVAGPAIEVAPAIAERSLPEAALLPGGAVDVVFQPPVPDDAGGASMFTPSHAILRRVEPSGALGAERRLAAAATTLGSSSPRISAGSDGSTTVTWIDVSSGDLGLVGFQQRPDGTTTTPRTLTRGFLTLFGLLAIGDVSQVVTSRLGVATAAWPEIGQRAATIVTARYDGIAPVVEAVVPATVSFGSDANFAVNVRDDSGVASVWWEFGDDSGSRRATTRHRYADPGLYTVTVTVVDGAGNETTATRQVSVVAPPPVATRVPAALKLAKVARRGAKVTVSGTLDRRASGRVTVAYSQKIGRRSHSKRTTVAIARGRFAATLRLTGALAKARGGKATVKVSYGGDADTNAGSASRTVNVPKAKPKKQKKAGPKQGKQRGKRR